MMNKKGGMTGKEAFAAVILFMIFGIAFSVIEFIKEHFIVFIVLLIVMLLVVAVKISELLADTKVNENNNVTENSQDCTKTINSFDNSHETGFKYNSSAFRPGTLVTHKSLGKGKIVNIEDGYMNIEFKNGIKKFKYPAAIIDGFITIDKG